MTIAVIGHRKLLPVVVSFRDIVDHDQPQPLVQKGHFNGHGLNIKQRPVFSFVAAFSRVAQCGDRTLQRIQQTRLIIGRTQIQSRQPEKLAGRVSVQRSRRLIGGYNTQSAGFDRPNRLWVPAKESLKSMAERNGRGERHSKFKECHKCKRNDNHSLND